MDRAKVRDIIMSIRDLEEGGLSGVGPGVVTKTLRDARELIEDLARRQVEVGE